MTKSELIELISKDANLTKADASRVLESTINAIMKATKNEQKVTLIGFGTFTLTERKARKGRNPQTGEKIDIPASKTPKFVAGRVFKDLINEK